MWYVSREVWSRTCRYVSREVWSRTCRYVSREVWSRTCRYVSREVWSRTCRYVSREVWSRTCRYVSPRSVVTAIVWYRTPLCSVNPVVMWPASSGRACHRLGDGRTQRAVSCFVSTVIVYIYLSIYLYIYIYILLFFFPATRQEIYLQ